MTSIDRLTDAQIKAGNKKASKSIGSRGRPPTPSGPIGGSQPATSSGPIGTSITPIFNQRSDLLPTPFQDILNRSGIGLQGHSVLSATYLYLDANSNPVYRVTTRSPWGSRVTNQYAIRGGKVFVQPAKPGIPAPSFTSGRGSPSVSRAKENWISWVIEQQDNGSFQPSTAAGYIGKIRDFEGSTADLNKWMQFVERNIFPAPAAHEAIFGDGPFDLGDESTGVGGFIGPEYVAPDRRVVEDFVKGTMVSLLGTITGDLDTIVDTYMKDHRRNFDNPAKQIDPGQSVTEAIRATQDYKTLHKLRPDSQDERTWIAARRSAAEQGGLNTEQLEDFSITQATAGSDVADIADAAAVRQTQFSGSTRGTVLANSVRSVAQGIFQGVRV